MAFSCVIISAWSFTTYPAPSASVSRSYQIPTSTILTGKSKWDSLIDEDEDEDLQFHVSIHCFL